MQLLRYHTSSLSFAVVSLSYWYYLTPWISLSTYPKPSKGSGPWLHIVTTQGQVIKSDARIKLLYNTMPSEPVPKDRLVPTRNMNKPQGPKNGSILHPG